MKILYIDDSPLFRAHLVSLIPEDIKPKLQIFQASDGEESLEIFNKENPEMVF